ncbi:MAG TPA: GntR family transcriptional regulator [Thermoanaerobaculia bacterium]|nr:GntR family transcriptional regulator [Thermoanaerobaculia bacterium]
MIAIDPRQAVPIWKQIEDEIRRMVAIGAYLPGAPVPSVRELAQILRINPATASKAYQRLTEAGVLTVRRGEGTFVAKSPTGPSAKERRESLGGAARRFAAVAATVGATHEEAMNAIQEALAKMESGVRNRR